MDRKAWIVIIICSIGLAVNWHFMQKQNAEYLEQQRKERLAEEARKAAETPAPGTEGDQPAEAGPGEEPGGQKPEVPEAPVEEELATLETNRVILTFTSHGGGIRHVEFKDQYAVGDGDHLVRLNRFTDHPIGALTGGTDRFLDVKYKIVEGSHTDQGISFVGQTPGGLAILKEWTLANESKRGRDYRLDLRITIENHGTGPVELRDLGIFAGSAAPLWSGEWDQYIGFFWLHDGSYDHKKVSWFKKGKRGPFETKTGGLEYAGVSNQFFTSVLSARDPYDADVWAASSTIQVPEVAGGGDGYEVRLGMSLPNHTLSKGGGQKVLDFSLFVGPKRNTMLRKMGEGYGHVMNYGWFGWVSRPLSWCLAVLDTKIFAPISKNWSWGWAVVALTILIRGAMWPLQNKSTRAMKRMAKLQPEMKALKEKYPDDPNKMNQEMMKMYREYGINPVGGCLPLVVQIPIFFGFYRMLQFAVELRQQPFLWVEDLSQPDTLFELPFSIPFLGNGFNLLPILMAVTMVLQMMMTPNTGDKMQRRIFMMMPVIFFFFCYNFASALALYWTTSNIFAIVQTLITKRLPEPELKKRGKAKKGFWQRMQERAEEAQKAQKSKQGEMMGNKGRKSRKRRPRTGG